MTKNKHPWYSSALKEQQKSQLGYVPKSNALELELKEEYKKVKGEESKDYVEKMISLLNPFYKFTSIY